MKVLQFPVKKKSVAEVEDYIRLLRSREKRATKLYICNECNGSGCNVCADDGVRRRRAIKFLGESI